MTNPVTIHTDPLTIIRWLALLFTGNLALILAALELGRHSSKPMQMFGLALLVLAPVLWGVVLVVWGHWHRLGRVSHGRWLPAGLFVPAVLFSLLGGRSDFPVAPYIGELFQTWYGLPRVVVFTLLPVLALGWLVPMALPFLRGGWGAFALAIVAGRATASAIWAADEIAGGAWNAPWGMFNFPDFVIHLHAAVNAMMASLGVVALRAWRLSGRRKIP